MATITSLTYLDQGAARTSGEAWTINSGGKLVIRTDTRYHLNAPASNLGSLGSITINEGELTFDGTHVRQIAFSGGTGTVPLYTHDISQGAVNGTFSGVFTSLTSTAIAPGSAMPASGIIKILDIEGGDFTTGAITWPTGSATCTSVSSQASWIEVVFDSGANITVPRLGLNSSIGDRFYLDNTTGIIGQQLQIPTSGSSTMFAPGVFIETSPGSGSFEFYPSLCGSTNGWTHIHVGEANGVSNPRAKFVLGLAGGKMQIGESWSASATYASLASQASTYVQISHSCTYVVENNTVIITYSTGHLLVDGQSTGLQFTSGGLSGVTGIYPITFIDPYTFSIPYTTANTSGNVTSRPGLTITFASHTVNLGEQVYCDFTSGGGVDGVYECYIAATTYSIKYPAIAAITSGNVSVIHTLTVTSTAHGLSIGQKVNLDFTSGTGLDGVYTIKATAANTFNINFPHPTATSGNVTIKRTIGYVPPAGCKTYIPNIIITEVATGARNLNIAPNATIASRPEWTTTSAGAINLSDLYCTSGYFNFGQAYSLALTNCVVFDTLVISETATALAIENVHTGMQGALDTPALNMTSNFAGGYLNNCKFQRGNTPGSSDNAININNCNNIEFTDIIGGIVQYARSTGAAWYVNLCNDLLISGCKALNGQFTGTVSKLTITSLDFCDRYNGNTNALTAVYALVLSSGEYMVNGITLGFNGLLDDCHPYSGLVSYTGNKKITFRNIGSFSSPLSFGKWRRDSVGCAGLFVTGGNNLNVRGQRCFMDSCRSVPFTTINSDKYVTMEQVQAGIYLDFGHTISSFADACLNSTIKGGKEINNTIGQASVYGTHFRDFFIGNTVGRILLAFNEPTQDTAIYYSKISGSPRFNSLGGLLMPTIGDKCSFETPYFIKGHTGFQNLAPVMSGGTITNYNITFQYDIGGGYLSERALNSTNLNLITIDPTIGIKLKIFITTTIANSTAITYLRIDTKSSYSAQNTDLYYLDVAKIFLDFEDSYANLRLQIVATDDDSEVYNGLVSGSNISIDIPFYVSDRLVRIRAIACNGITAAKFIELYEYVTINGLNKLIQLEQDLVYSSNAIDGSTVTTVAIDDSSLLVNVNDNAITWAEIYAYETYWLTTTEGIRDEGRFIEAVDNANYILENFKIKNIGANPLVITGGWAWDRITGRSIDLIDTTGNTIFNAPDHVVSYATGGSALTTEEHNKLMSGASKGDIWAAAVLGA